MPVYIGLFSKPELQACRLVTSTELSGGFFGRGFEPALEQKKNAAGVGNLEGESTSELQSLNVILNVKRLCRKDCPTEYQSTCNLLKAITITIFDYNNTIICEKLV